MATWAKEDAKFALMDEDGNWDTTSHTVEVYPMTETYPTGKITCSQLTSQFAYQPDSDLDDDYHYWIRVDGEDKYPLFSPQSYPAIGE